VQKDSSESGNEDVEAAEEPAVRAAGVSAAAQRLTPVEDKEAEQKRLRKNTMERDSRARRTASAAAAASAEAEALNAAAVEAKRAAAAVANDSEHGSDSSDDGDEALGSLASSAAPPPSCSSAAPSPPSAREAALSQELAAASGELAREKRLREATALKAKERFAAERVLRVAWKDKEAELRHR
jgi:hypothetical protein